jgi:hypothetical protein
MVDNSWIVPYCPYLSATYDCHINVECAVSLGSFKYAFKYIQKGGDLAGIEVSRRDEIKRWIEGRYISASEAAWRIFHFDMHDQVPNVVRLQVSNPFTQTFFPFSFTVAFRSIFQGSIWSLSIPTTMHKKSCSGPQLSRPD